jgi:hypothetical protein
MNFFPSPAGRQVEQMTVRRFFIDKDKRLLSRFVPTELLPFQMAGTVTHPANIDMSYWVMTVRLIYSLLIMLGRSRRRP